MAIRSADHQRPRGTKGDNTRHPRFVRRTEEIFNRELDWEERVAWTAGLTAGGAAAGAGIGYVTRSVSWQPVDLVTLKPQVARTLPAARVSWTVRF